MKKRWVGLVCAMCVALTVFFRAGGPAGAASYEGVYLVGVNDTVLLGLINKENMPIVRSGAIYAPYTVLSNRELGLSYIINKNEGTFTIYTQKKTLVFPTTGAGATDKEGNEYTDRIIIRSGTVYIPLRFVASFFGLSYSYYTLTLSDGVVPMVRLCNQNAQLDDKQFGTSAAQLAQQPLSQYAAAQATPTPTPAVTPTPTPTRWPATPTPTPTAAVPSPGVTAAPSPSPSPSQEPPRAVMVCLAVACTDGAGFDDALAALERWGASALFLFEPDRLAQRDDDLRRAAAAGHQIGLLLPQEDPDGAFEQANDLLRHILRGSAAQAAFLDGDAQEGNWRVFQSNVTVRGRTESARRRNLLDDLQDLPEGEEGYVMVTDSAAGARLLGAVLPELAVEPYTLRVATD